MTIMEELTGMGRKKERDVKHKEKIEQLIICKYEDPSSPAFGKTASTVKRVVLKKHPTLINGVSDKRVRQILEEQFTTYARTKVTKQNKSFFSTSFYSNHPHYRWHVDLQDMSIFKHLRLADRFNLMLICIDDFSNYMMVKLLCNNCATTVHKAHIFDFVVVKINASSNVMQMDPTSVCK